MSTRGKTEPNEHKIRSEDSRIFEPILTNALFEDFSSRGRTFHSYAFSYQTSRKRIFEKLARTSILFSIVPTLICFTFEQEERLTNHQIEQCHHPVDGRQQGLQRFNACIEVRGLRKIPNESKVADRMNSKSSSFFPLIIINSRNGIELHEEHRQLSQPHFQIPQE